MIRRKSGATSASKTEQILVLWLARTHLRGLWIRQKEIAGADWVTLKEGWLRSGDLLDPNLLEQGVVELLRRLNHQGSSQVIWLLPPEMMSLRISQAPNLEGETLEKALSLEAQTLPPDHGGEVFPRISLHPGVDRRYAAIGKIYASTAELLHKITRERQKQRLWDIEQQGVALAVRHAAAFKESGLWAILYLEPGNSVLAFFWNDRQVRTRILVDLLDPWIHHLGSEEALLKSLMGGMDGTPLDAQATEQVFTQINRAIEETLLQIARDGLSIELTKAANQQELRALYISGLGALEENLFQQLQNSYGYLFKVERIETTGHQGAFWGPLMAVLDGQRVSRLRFSEESFALEELSRWLNPALLVLGVLSLGGLGYNLMLNRQIAGLKTQVARLKPEETRQEALQASIKALEDKVRAAWSLQPRDWTKELQPLLESLPRAEQELEIGFRRVVVKSDAHKHQYSLEGVARNKEALETFLRRWEERPGHTANLSHWAREKQKGTYAFTVTVSALREEEDEQSQP